MIRTIAGIACALLIVGAAQAQERKALPKLVPPTGNLVRDISTINQQQKAASSSSTTQTACDFNLFASLTADNVISSIQACLNSQLEGVSNLFLPDVTAALASANTYGDQPGVACLKPALAIVQAGAGTPAVPAVPAVPATATTPEIPAVPAVPAQSPGPILIFQKFREFELSGGPAACKTWVSSTVAGANPLTN